METPLSMHDRPFAIEPSSWSQTLICCIEGDWHVNTLEIPCPPRPFQCIVRLCLASKALPRESCKRDELCDMAAVFAKCERGWIEITRCFMLLFLDLTPPVFLRPVCTRARTNAWLIIGKELFTYHARMKWGKELSTVSWSLINLSNAISR
jgi:hypothetical protein